MQVLCVLADHPARLSELRRHIPAASKKGLTSSLRALELAKVVLRRDLSTSVLHVEYELAPSVRDCTLELLEHIARWTELISTTVDA